MKKSILIQGALFILAAGTVLGADDMSTTTTTTTTGSNVHYDPHAEDLFRANELSLDGFGTVALGQQTLDHISRQRINQNARLGIGGGLNYFFTRNIGVGGEAYTENTSHNFIDDVSGNLIGRLPLGQSGFAPYIFGGGGHKFDPVEASFLQAGGGFEFRFTHNIGVFADARFVFINKISDYGLGRAGLRIAF